MKKRIVIIGSLILLLLFFVGTSSVNASIYHLFTTNCQNGVLRAGPSASGPWVDIEPCYWVAGCTYIKPYSFPCQAVFLQKGCNNKYTFKWNYCTNAAHVVNGAAPNNVALVTLVEPTCCYGVSMRVVGPLSPDTFIVDTTEATHFVVGDVIITDTTVIDTIYNQFFGLTTDPADSISIYGGASIFPYQPMGPSDSIEISMHWIPSYCDSGYGSKTKVANAAFSTKSVKQVSLIGGDTTDLAPGYTSWYYSDGAHSTEVALANFDARSDNGIIKLDWTTGNEIDNLGFNVYRSESQEGEYIRINTDMISAKGSSFSGASYSFTDNEVTPNQTYYYKLEDIDIDGFNTFHGPVMAKVTQVAPTQFALGQNYPNPFNASTQISYTLKSDEIVTLKIYNVLGQEVKTLVDKHQFAGTHTVTWNGKDSKGNDVATGIYFYRIKAGDFSAERKMAYLK